MGFVDVFALGIGAAIAAMYVKTKGQDVTFVKSSYDGDTYLVRQAGDALEAANTLARLNECVGVLMAHLELRYPTDERVLLLKGRYNKDALSEGAHNSGYTSYSVDKGKSIIMCLRSRDVGGTHGRIEKINTLTYVLLHELAHLATDEVGHTPVFWANFDFIKREAVAAGVYDEVDYAKQPAGYCGMVIGNTKKAP